jgi:hypothetical protein
MRDTDGDGQPDTVSATFSTEDDMAFIGFPYDHMQDGMDFWNKVIMKGNINISGENHPGPWDGGEEGFRFTSAWLQHKTGSVKVELYLDEKLMQTIQCEILEP